MFNKYYNKNFSENCHNYYMIWDGSFESTLVLYNLLDKYGGNKVTAVSFNYPELNQNKCRNEISYREDFKTAMKIRGEKYSNFKHIDINVEITPDTDINIYDSGLKRIFSELMNVCIYMKPNSFIYTYNNSSNFNKEYKSMLQSISNILNKTIYFDNHYSSMSKNKIIEKVIDNNLYNFGWICENVSIDSRMCYKCDSCKNHISSLIHLAFYSENEYIKAKARFILDNLDISMISENESIDIIDSVRYIQNNELFIIEDNEIIGLTVIGKLEKEIIIPDEITNIGDGAFSHCTNLTNITIPNSVTKIGDDAFDYCIRLTTIYYEGTEEDWNNITNEDYGILVIFNTLL